MEIKWRLLIIIGIGSGISLIILLCLIYLFCRKKPAIDESEELKSSEYGEEELVEEEELETEELICFQGGENLTIQDILDAPGEVVGKSNYGTLYKASLERENSVKLLRFLRPTCTGRMKEFFPVIQILGFIRHPNLVPLQAFYSGTRGEKLLVHPFFVHGNLVQFLRGNSLFFNFILMILVFVSAYTKWVSVDSNKNLEIDQLDDLKNREINYS